MYLDKLYQILPMSVMLMVIMLMASITSMTALLYTNVKISKKEEKKKKKKGVIMLLSLFISFDPKSSILSEMNWTCILIPTILLMYFLWTKPSRLICFTKTLINNIEEQFSIALKSKMDNSSNIFISVFLMIMICNLMGLMPNIFTGTSHISMNMMISTPMWMGFLLYGWIKFTNKMFAHLVPNGTPTMLINFMVIIEMISNSIRPLTLSIRLMANMVSGHLLLTLMGNTMNDSNYLVCILMILVQMVLTVLEMGVALIQAYVFCMLLTLYSDDSDYMKKN